MRTEVAIKNCRCAWTQTQSWPY